MQALIVANWKMNPATLRDAKKLLEATKKAATGAKGVSVVVAPPAIFLASLSSGRGKIAFAAQNMHFETAGSHTGEISASQIKDAKATYVLIGHAERRSMGETDDDVRKKVGAALAQGLTAIVCVGEKSRDADASHFAVVRDQLRTGLPQDIEKRLSKLVVVYEPLWTIGQTKSMQPREMHEMSIFIRKTLVEKFGGAGHDVKVLYGGSVDASNAGEMMREGDVRGLLVGRASIDGAAFAELLKAVARA